MWIHTHNLAIVISLVCLGLIGICLLLHAFRVRDECGGRMFAPTLMTSVVAMLFPVGMAAFRFTEIAIVGGLFVLGVLLIFIEVRRKCTAYTIRCCRCRYDLSGLPYVFCIHDRIPAPGAITHCPECGSGIRPGRVVRLAYCAKSSRCRIGAALVVGCVAWSCWPDAYSLRRFNWRPHVSASILAWDLERQRAAPMNKSLREVRRRLEAGESASVELAPVANTLLNRWENPAPSWPSRWTPLMEEIVESGTMSQAQWRRYLAGLMAVQPVVIDDVRPGEPFRFELHGEDNADMSRSRLDTHTFRMQSPPSTMWGIIDSDIVEVQIGAHTMPVHTRRGWKYPDTCYGPYYRILERRVEQAPVALPLGEITIRVFVVHTAWPDNPQRLPASVRPATRGMPVQWSEVFEIPVEIAAGTGVSRKDPSEHASLR